MKCYKCGKNAAEIIKKGMSMRAVDKPGTEDRKWICNECENKDPETLESILFNKN